MYAFIEGTVCEKTNGCLVLQAGGVGWQLSCSNNTLMAAPALGETMRCFTFLSVREDALELFGFATREEKEMFLQLNWFRLVILSFQMWLKLLPELLHMQPHVTDGFCLQQIGMA